MLAQLQFAVPANRKPPLEHRSCVRCILECKCPVRFHSQSRHHSTLTHQQFLLPDQIDSSARFTCLRQMRLQCSLPGSTALVYRQIRFVGLLNRQECSSKTSETEKNRCPRRQLKSKWTVSYRLVQRNSLTTCVLYTINVKVISRTIFRVHFSCQLTIFWIFPDSDWNQWMFSIEWFNCTILCLLLIGAFLVMLHGIWVFVTFYRRNVEFLLFSTRNSDCTWQKSTKSAITSKGKAHNDGKFPDNQTKYYKFHTDALQSLACAAEHFTCTHAVCWSRKCTISTNTGRAKEFLWIVHRHGWCWAMFVCRGNRHTPPSSSATVRMQCGCGCVKKKPKLLSYVLNSEFPAAAAAAQCVTQYQIPE